MKRARRRRGLARRYGRSVAGAGLAEEAALRKALHEHQRQCRERKALLKTAVRQLQKDSAREEKRAVAHFRKLDQALAEALDPDGVIVAEVLVDWSPSFGDVRDYISIDDMPSCDISEALEDIDRAKHDAAEYLASPWEES
jgi:hypothetical protein